MKKMKELKLLEKKWGLKLVELPKGDLEIESLFVIVYDTRKLHDSGYPFIRIFGEIKGKKIVDLGWHDHYLVNVPINVDAYGKNIFHIMPWMNTKFQIKGGVWFCSTFEIDKNGILM